MTKLVNILVTKFLVKVRIQFEWLVVVVRWRGQTAMLSVQWRH